MNKISDNLQVAQAPFVTLTRATFLPEEGSGKVHRRVCGANRAWTAEDVGPYSKIKYVDGNMQDHLCESSCLKFFAELSFKKATKN